MHPRTIFASACLVAAMLSAQPSRADGSWGCKVILCLASPDSPTQYGECVPPIHKLYSELAKGNPFPTCDDVSEAGITTNRWTDPQEECPAGDVEEVVQVTDDRGHDSRVRMCKSPNPIGDVVRSYCGRNCGDQDRYRIVSGPQTGQSFTLPGAPYKVEGSRAWSFRAAPRADRRNVMALIQDGQEITRFRY